MIKELTSIGLVWNTGFFFSGNELISLNFLCSKNGQICNSNLFGMHNFFLLIPVVNELIPTNFLCSKNEQIYNSDLFFPSLHICFSP